MNPIRYAKATDYDEAIAAVVQERNARYIAGGTTIVDLMKDHVEEPSMLVDITGLPMRAIETTSGGGLRLGSLATMADVADSPLVQAGFPAVSQALLASASPQLRNMATIGGNVMQRTRCSYFRDTSQPCNKRKPGKGCSALEGQNRFHSVIGTSPNCICSHPSDFAAALVAVDAVIHTRTQTGTRRIAIEDLYVLPGHRPNVENVLHPGELIEAIELPASAHARNSAYLKVRDRASYEFALVSVAAALAVENGIVREARIALGSVAPTPWRAHAAEASLIGKPAGDTSFAAAAEVAIVGMRGYGHNDYKIPLTRESVRRALAMTGGVA